MSGRSMLKFMVVIYKRPGHEKAKNFGDT